MLLQYASYAKEFAKRGDLSGEMWDTLGKDELRELSEDLVRLGDQFGGGEVDEEEEVGEDGEYEIDA